MFSNLQLESPRKIWEVTATMIWKPSRTGVFQEPTCSDSYLGCGEPIILWKKSCTTWDGSYPVNNEINYLSTGAGFLPSTVSFIIFIKYL